MRIAFYAPMKPPDSPVPSGDRTIARALIRALDMGGHDVFIASQFQSREPLGDPDRQRAVQEEGGAIATSLVETYRGSDGPDLWFTYHLYYKAPDWIGPIVAGEMGIPYVAAEASHAPKRAGGRWDINHCQVEKSVVEADLIVGLNSLDARCIRPLLSGPEKMIQLRPFMEAPADLRYDRHGLRKTWSERFGIPLDRPWYLAAAMMRPGAKLQSYSTLAEALRKLGSENYALIIAGDGPAREEIEALCKSLPVYFTGEVRAEDLLGLMSSSDLFVWPAIDEAYGMAILEAQSQGLPVIAGRSGGVGDIVRDGETGTLVPVGDAEAFAAAIRELTMDVQARQDMSQNSRQVFERDHTLDFASAQLNQALEALVHG